MDTKGFTVVIWLPNKPSTQGEIMAAFGNTAKIEDQRFEMTRLVPDYPDGLDGPVMQLTVTFEAVEEAPFLVSFDDLLLGAFSPWPRRPEDGGAGRIKHSEL